MIIINRFLFVSAVPTAMISCNALVAIGWIGILVYLKYTERRKEIILQQLI